jgi:ATP synthase protein I
VSDDDKDRNLRAGQISPEDREQFRRRAAELGQRLDKAHAPTSDGVRKPGAGRPDETDGAVRGQALGQGFRIATELVVGVAAGGLLGWFLDRQIGWSGPWFLIVFLMLGFAGGMMNVIRIAKRMQARSEPMQRSATKAKDDKDDDA